MTLGPVSLLLSDWLLPALASFLRSGLPSPAPGPFPTSLYDCEVRRPPGAQPELTFGTADAGALTSAHLFHQRTKEGTQRVRFTGDFPGVGTESPASEETLRSPTNHSNGSPDGAWYI